MNGRRIQHGVVDSTSERAFAALEAGSARHGDVHLAREQTRGRGRLGRRWLSAPDEGVYMSMVLLPPPPPLSSAGLSMSAALGALDALSEMGAEGVRLAWPNDVHVGAAKIAGILIESRGLDPERPHYVLGVGLNVRQREFPAELTEEREVTSLARLGIELEIDIARETLIAALQARLERLGDDAEGIARDYAKALGLAGAWVEVGAGGGHWKGVLSELSLAGGLVLTLEGGQRACLPLESVTRLGPPTDAQR